VTILVAGRAKSAWPTGAWLLLAAVVVTAGAGIGTAILSPALLLDLVSLWSGTVPALVAALIIGLRRNHSPRSPAVVPLLLFTWLVLAVASHLIAWAPLPSSAAELSGPGADGIPVVGLSVDSGGELVVTEGLPGPAYQVEFIRRGGVVGVPVATELSLPESLAVDVEAHNTSIWYRFAGWRVTLDPRPVWDLSLSGQVRADLGSLKVNSLRVEGGGVVILGVADGPTTVNIGGIFQVFLPSGAAAEVRGGARSPWPVTDGVARSPISGEGWIISADSRTTVSVLPSG
jgi:hypothetical protein